MTGFKRCRSKQGGTLSIPWQGPPVIVTGAYNLPPEKIDTTVKKEQYKPSQKKHKSSQGLKEKSK